MRVPALLAFLATLATLATLILSSCCETPQAAPAPVTTYNISIKPLGPEDKSVASPNFIQKKYKKMILKNRFLILYLIQKN